MLTAYIVYWNFIQEPILARGRNTPSIGCQSIAGDHAQCSGSLVLPIHQATRFLKENSWTHTYTHTHTITRAQNWTWEPGAMRQQRYTKKQDDSWSWTHFWSWYVLRFSLKIFFCFCFFPPLHLQLYVLLPFVQTFRGYYWVLMVCL